MGFWDWEDAPTTVMTTPPPVQRARLTDAQLRPHRPTVEVLVPAGGGLLAKIGRGVKAILRMRQAEAGHAIQIYRMRGQRDVSACRSSPPTRKSSTC